MMNLDNNKDDVNTRYQNRSVKEILHSLLQTPIGIHQIVVYPNNIEILREAYFHYIKKLLEDENEMVIFLPYHESADSVKNMLTSSYTNSNNNSNDKNNNDNYNKQKALSEKELEERTNMQKYINNGSLVIIDSDNTFSNIGETPITNQTDQSDMKIDKNSFISLIRMSLVHAKKLNKESVTILADYGSLYKKNGFTSLLELEKSIPPTFDHINIKQICLYNQNDFFHKFTKQEKKEILDLHGRSIIMMDS
jgi:hypothetical protein